MRGPLFSYWVNYLATYLIWFVVSQSWWRLKGTTLLLEAILKNHAKPLIDILKLSSNGTSIHCENFFKGNYRYLN